MERFFVGIKRIPGLLAPINAILVVHCADPKVEIRAFELAWHLPESLAAVLFIMLSMRFSNAMPALVQTALKYTFVAVFGFGQNTK